MLPYQNEIRSIVFDLDGTLYVSPALYENVQQAAEELVSDSRGATPEESRILLKNAHQRLSEALDEEPTLTRTCMELGLEVQELHQAIQDKVHPERFLEPDPVLYALVDSLRDSCDLYIYTNNNLLLTRKILALLGIEDLFRHLYTIEFSWNPKPDPDSLQRVLEDIGGPPESFLFVGDRRQVDLGPAESFGIPTLLVSETADLLQIHKLMGIVP